MGEAPEPIYYSVRFIADLMLDEKTGETWSTKRTRRWLQRSGALKKLQGQGRWVTTGSMLREAFPDVWYRIQSEL